MRKRLLLATALAAIAAVAFASLALAKGSGYGGSGGSGAISVSVKEFSIAGLPKPKGQTAAGIAPGSVTLTIRNRGQFPHNIVLLTVNAKGAIKHVAGIAPIPKGETGTLTANLKPGAYIAVCTVGTGYHASQGMYTRFTVGTNGLDFDTGKWG
jgi:hypothetical protein